MPTETLDSNLIRHLIFKAKLHSWYERWSEIIEAGDPFYSPHLTRDREDPSLRALPGA